ncbi:MAG: ABC transporter permease subunit [Chloroflexi bacterium]|nr:ABC transporter permease subunit [Chloroflexota bacterium]
MAERAGGPAVGAWFLVAGALLLLVVLPLVTLVANALADGAGPLATLASDTAIEAWRHSVLVAAAVTVLAVVGGVVGALVTERTDVRGRTLLRLGMVLPLLVPDFVAGFSWLQAYAPGGLTDDLAGVSLPWLAGPIGVVAVLAAGAVPLVYLVVASGLATRAEPELERAARASGGGRLIAWRTVTIPLAAPSIAAAAALVMVTSDPDGGIELIRNRLWAGLLASGRAAVAVPGGYHGRAARGRASDGGDPRDRSAARAGQLDARPLPGGAEQPIRHGDR